MDVYALTLLQREFRELAQSEDSGFSVGLEGDDWFRWRVCFQGPVDTPYEGGVFVAILRFPRDYPNSPPEMQFITEMWHPNSTPQAVFPDGRVCISILHPPGVDQFNQLESADERWRPILGVESVLLSVTSMLNDPNPNSPANIEASVQFTQVQYRNNRSEYTRKVRRLAQKSVDFL